MTSLRHTGFGITKQAASRFRNQVPGPVPSSGRNSATCVPSPPARYPATTREHGRAPEPPKPSFRPSRRPGPSPGGSGAPTGPPGARPQARKAPKSPDRPPAGLPAGPFMAVKKEPLRSGGRIGRRCMPGGWGGAGEAGGGLGGAQFNSCPGNRTSNPGTDPRPIGRSDLGYECSSGDLLL